jgi:membrane protease YdiL (CAAX protease family)
VAEALLASKEVSELSTTASAPNLRTPSSSTGKLVAWLGVVGALIALNYVGEYATHPDKAAMKVEFYKYSTAVGALFEYAILLLLVCWIAGWRGELLAWRAPRSWPRALGWAVLVLVCILVANALIDPFLHAGREQGAIPPSWEPAHAGAYLTNWLVVAGVAPFVEETTFRGLGGSLIYARWGSTVSIIAVGLLFGLAHGLLQALPELAIFGGALMWLRLKVDSTYPGMLVHCAFNSLALAAVFWH